MYAYLHVPMYAYELVYVDGCGMNDDIEVHACVACACTHVLHVCVTELMSK